jgi:hypothetical protein
MLFRNPVEFEIPDDWWSEADMLGFTSEGQADHAVPGSDLKLCGPKRYREMLERLKASGVTIAAGPLLTIPPAIHSFYPKLTPHQQREALERLAQDETQRSVARSYNVSQATISRLRA